MKKGLPVLSLLFCLLTFSCSEKEEVVPEPRSVAYVGSYTTKTLSEGISNGVTTHHVGAKALLKKRPGGAAADSLLSIEVFSYHISLLHAEDSILLRPDNTFGLKYPYQNADWEVRISGKLTSDSLYYEQQLWNAGWEYGEITGSFKGAIVKE